MGTGNYTDKMGEIDMTYRPKNCKNEGGTIWDAGKKNNRISTDKVSKRNKKEGLEILGSAAYHLINGNNIISRIHQ